MLDFSVSAEIEQSKISENWEPTGFWDFAKRTQHLSCGRSNLHSFFISINIKWLFLIIETKYRDERNEQILICRRISCFSRIWKVQYSNKHSCPLEVLTFELSLKSPKLRNYSKNENESYERSLFKYMIFEVFNVKFVH